MQFQGLLLHALLSGASVASAAAAKCSADSCLAIVRQGKKAGGFGGCGGFFKTTVIPAAMKSTTTTTLITTVASTETVKGTASTTTQTTTTTTSPSTSIATSTTTITTTITTTTLSAAPKKRTVSSSNTPTTTSQTTVPKYARKQCQNTARYASACSCIGVQHKTVSADTPTVTVTSQRKTTSVITTTSTSTDVSTSISTSTELSTVVTTTTVTATATCSPTQVVKNGGFDMEQARLQPIDWTLSSTGSYIGYYYYDPTDAYSGSGFVLTVDDGGDSTSSVSQTLTNPITTTPINYSFSAAIGEFNRQITTSLAVTITLDGHTIVPNQLVCPTLTSCGVIRGSFRYRFLSLEGTLPSLSANPVLAIIYTTNEQTGGAGIDQVQLSLSC